MDAECGDFEGWNLVDEEEEAAAEAAEVAAAEEGMAADGVDFREEDDGMFVAVYCVLLEESCCCCWNRTWSWRMDRMVEKSLETLVSNWSNCLWRKMEHV